MARAWPSIRSTLAQTQRQAVAGGKARMVAGGAGDIAVARQDAVVEQKLAQLDLGRIYGAIVIVCDRGRQPGGPGRRRTKQKRGSCQNKRADHGTLVRR